MNTKITKNECTEIRTLHEKRLALENLAKIISPSQMPELYERLVSDYGPVVAQYEDWWSSIFKKYQMAPGTYVVDFENLELIPASET